MTDEKSNIEKVWHNAVFIETMTHGGKREVSRTMVTFGKLMRAEGDRSQEWREALEKIAAGERAAMVKIGPGPIYRIHF